MMIMEAVNQLDGTEAHDRLQKCVSIQKTSCLDSKLREIDKIVFGDNGIYELVDSDELMLTIENSSCLKSGMVALTELHPHSRTARIRLNMSRVRDATTVGSNVCIDVHTCTVLTLIHEYVHLLHMIHAVQAGKRLMTNKHDSQYRHMLRHMFGIDGVVAHTQ